MAISSTVVENNNMLNFLEKIVVQCLNAFQVVIQTNKRINKLKTIYMRQFFTYLFQSVKDQLMCLKTIDNYSTEYNDQLSIKLKFPWMNERSVRARLPLYIASTTSCNSLTDHFLLKSMIKQIL